MGKKHWVERELMLLRSWDQGQVEIRKKSILNLLPNRTTASQKSVFLLKELYLFLMY